MALVIIKFERKFLRPMIAASVVLCLIGGWYFAKWNFANAVSMRADTREIADLGVEMAPGDPQTHFAAAVVYEKTFDPGDLTRSLNEYETVAALSPNNYISWLELGRARERNGDAPGAETAFLRALDLAPNYADVQWAYGNLLIRQGRHAEGLAQIRVAYVAKPEYVNPAAITAMTLFDGDAAKARDALGGTPDLNAALAALELSSKRYGEAVASWDLIPADEKLSKFKAAGETLSGRLADARQFRLASHIINTIWDGDGPVTGSILNGGFESQIKLNDARLFDWQISPGAEPQIGLNDEQKHGGGYSLFMKFNTMQAADFRSFSQTVAVEPGKAYSLEGFYRANLKGTIAWEIVDAAAGKSLAKSMAINGASDWTAFRINFTTPADVDGVIIRLIRDGCASPVCPISGKVWFDDFTLGRQ